MWIDLLKNKDSLFLLGSDQIGPLPLNSLTVYQISSGTIVLGSCGGLGRAVAGELAGFAGVKLFGEY